MSYKSKGLMLRGPGRSASIDGQGPTEGSHQLRVPHKNTTRVFLSQLFACSTQWGISQLTLSNEKA